MRISGSFVKNFFLQETDNENFQSSSRSYSLKVNTVAIQESHSVVMLKFTTLMSRRN